MKPLILIPALLALALPAFAEQPTRVQKIVVTPAGHEAEIGQQTRTVQVVDTDELSGGRAARSIQDAIDRIPSVMMQRTGPGQGSAYIRALTGFRVLHLVDGIRLNNSTWRSGPNQYLATVDSFSLRSAEVVQGPSSVLYGSDSLGGTINALPLTPEMTDGEYEWGGRFLERLASGENSGIFRGEVSGGLGPDFGILFGGTRKFFGEMRAGDGKLDETDYDEWDADARAIWHAAPGLDLIFGFQHVSQDDAPRVHKTVDGKPWHGTTRGSELKRDLDQVRDLLFLRAETEDVTATLSWQRQREKRDRDRVGRSDKQGVTVSTWGLSIAATTETDFGTLTYGADGYYDLVDSFRKNYDANGNVTSEGIQGPVADNSDYTLIGAFLQNEYPVTEDLVLTGGVRFSYARANADQFEDPVSGESESFDDDWSAVVGSLRFLWNATEDWSFYGGVSQGFRAPNLSDLTRLDSARSNEIETPSTDLDPEYAWAFELGTRARVGPARFTLTLFDTELEDTIQLFPTGRVIDGDNEVTKDNVGDGYVRGVELSGEVDLGDGFVAYGAGSWMTGKVDTYTTSEREKTEEWLDRLPPLSGVVGVRYFAPRGLTLMAQVRMADKADRLSPRDEGDTQRIPPGGTPGYAVVDIEANWVADEHFTATLGIENLFDQAYRIHGSGQNQPGINVYFVAEIRF
jgi:hemoglobin/transferrin/lactoferrin receptor protein